LYPQNTSLKVDSEEATPGCWPSRVAKKKPYLRLANKNKTLRWAKEHRHWTEELKKSAFLSKQGHF
jgi:hypothetical protein